MNDKTYDKKTKARQTKNKPQITDVFTVICKTDLRVECVKEYKFHPTRKWRFDFAIPEHKIAIEIDGGVWNYGRHNRAQGYLADMKKFNAAASLGWIVLKFTPDEQYSRATFDIIRETIKNRENERNMERHTKL